MIKKTIFIVLTLILLVTSTVLKVNKYGSSPLFFNNIIEVEKASAQESTLVPEVYDVKVSLVDTLNNPDPSKNPYISIWKEMLNLCNIAVVAFLLFVSFATIFHINLDLYGVKKALPAVLIGIVMANFSYFIVKSGIEIAETLSYSMVSSGIELSDCKEPRGEAGKCFVDEINYAIFNSAFTALWKNNNAKYGVATTATVTIAAVIGYFAFLGLGVFSGALLVVGVILIFCYSVIIVAIFYILGFLFIIRGYVLIFILIVSPAAFLCVSWDPLKNYFKQWWTQFLRWAFMAPVCVFFLWLIIVFRRAVTDGGSEPNIATVAIAVFLLYMAIQVPFKMGGTIMTAWAGFGKKLAKTGWGAWGKGFGSLNNKFDDMKKNPELYKNNWLLNRNSKIRDAKGEDKLKLIQEFGTRNSKKIGWANIPYLAKAAKLRYEQGGKKADIGGQKTIPFGLVAGPDHLIQVMKELQRPGILNAPREQQDYIVSRFINEVLDSKGKEEEVDAFKNFQWILKDKGKLASDEVDFDDSGTDQSKVAKAKALQGLYLSTMNRIREARGKGEFKNWNEAKGDKEYQGLADSQLMMEGIIDFLRGNNEGDLIRYPAIIGAIKRATGDSMDTRSSTGLSLNAYGVSANIRRFDGAIDKGNINRTLIEGETLDESSPSKKGAAFHDYPLAVGKPVAPNRGGGTPQPPRQTNQSEIEKLEKRRKVLEDEKSGLEDREVETSSIDAELKEINRKLNNTSSSAHATESKPPVVNVINDESIGGVTADSVTAETATTDPEAVQNQYLDRLIEQISMAISEGIKEGFTGLDLSKIKVDTGKAQLDASTALAPFQLQALGRVGVREKLFRSRMLKSLRSIAFGVDKKDPQQGKIINNEINNIETSIDQSFERGEMPTVEQAIKNNPTINNYLVNHPEQAPIIKNEIKEYIGAVATKQKIIEHDFGPAMEIIRGPMHGIIVNSSVSETADRQIPVMPAPINIGKGGVAEPTMRSPEISSSSQTGFNKDLQTSRPTATGENRSKASESKAGADQLEELSDVSLESVEGGKTNS